MFYLLKILVVICGGVAVYCSVIPCLPNNKTHALAFVDPFGPRRSPYPAKIYMNRMRRFTMTCCGTGFSTVNWYKDGEDLGPERIFGNDSHTYSQNRQTVVFSLDEALLAEHIFTCELVGVNGSTLSHDIEYIGFKSAPPSDVPVFTVRPLDACVKPGSDVVITSELHYLENNTCDYFPFLCKLNVAYVNGTHLKNNRHMHRQYHRQDMGDGTIKVNITITFISIPEEYLDKEYVVAPLTHLWVREVFQIQSSIICDPDDGIRNVTEIVSSFSNDVHDVAISCSVVTVVVVLALLAVTLTQYEVRLWIKVNLLHKLHKPDGTGKNYDVYLIASEKGLAAAFDDIQVLESQSLRFCLPQRDFDIGAVIPNQIAESIRSSSYVLALLSNDMFSEDSWCDVALSLSISLRKPLILIVMEKLKSENLKKRRDTRAALKVFKTIRLDGEKRSLDLTDVFQTQLNVAKRQRHDKPHSFNA